MTLRTLGTIALLLSVAIIAMLEAFRMGWL